MDGGSSLFTAGGGWRFSQDLQPKMRDYIQYLNGMYKDCSFSCNLTHRVMRMTDLLNEINISFDLAKQNNTLLKSNLDESLYKNIISDYKLLIIELDLGNSVELRKIIDGLFREFKDTSAENIKFIMKNLYSVIEMNYKKRKISTWDITNGKFDYNNLYAVETSDGIANCVKEDFSALCEGLKGIVPQNEYGVIGRITEYLKENIGEEMSHDAVAAKYHMHPAYLSRLFKQTTGETVSEYVFRIKIEKAAELLKKQYKVSDVAVAIGYSGSSYFSIMFKRHTGYSPTEYRQRILL